MTLEEQEKYRLQAEMMKKIRQPSLDAMSSVGNNLSGIKDVLNSFGKKNVNPSFGVESPETYNNPNLQNTVPLGNVLLGNSDRFFNSLGSDKMPTTMDGIDAATLFPIAGLATKLGIRSGSKLLGRVFNKPIITPAQPSIDFFDLIKNNSVFNKSSNIKTKNLNVDQKIYHEDNTLSGINKNLIPYEKDLNITLKNIAPEAEVTTRTKLPEKIKLKANEGKNINNISDIMGGRIAVNTPEEVMTTLDKLYKNTNVVKVDNYYTPRGLGDGYRAVHVQILNNKGATAEIQIIPKDFIPINNAGKSYYNNARHNPNMGMFEKLKNNVLGKSSKMQRDSLFEELGRKPGNQDLKKSAVSIYPASRGLLSE